MINPIILALTGTALALASAPALAVDVTAATPRVHADKANQDYVVGEGSTLRGTVFSNMHFIFNTKQKSTTTNNLFANCTFTIDGKDYKTPDEVKKAFDILSNKSPNVIFKGNQVD